MKTSLKTAKGGLTAFLNPSFTVAQVKILFPQKLLNYKFIT